MLTRIEAPSIGMATGSLPLARYRVAAKAIVTRELLRFLHQRERLVSAVVRPLIWIVVFAAGFRGILGLPVQEPYATYVSYEVYMVPGLAAMILLFSSMQSSLSMVYDREMGSMRILLTAPLPRPFLLAAKLLAGTIVAVLQVYVFLLVVRLIGVEPPAWGYLAVLPALVLSGLMLGAIGMLLASTIRQLENFAGVMNFVIFPAFFFSSALYPLWRMKESDLTIYLISAANPFTHAVELIRFALYGSMNWSAAAVVTLTTAVLFAAAAHAFDPARGIQARVRSGDR